MRTVGRSKKSSRLFKHLLGKHISSFERFLAESKWDLHAVRKKLGQNYSVQFISPIDDPRSFAGGLRHSPGKPPGILIWIDLPQKESWGVRIRLLPVLLRVAARHIFRYSATTRSNTTSAAVSWKPWASVYRWANAIWRPRANFATMDEKDTSSTTRRTYSYRA